MNKSFKAILKFFFVLLIIQGVCLAGLNGKRARIVNVIDSELKELSRLSRVSGNRDPEMLLRIAELYLEKGRILREQENEDFFNLPLKTRRKIDRKKFYAKSMKLIRKAQETGLYILKRFKNFKDKSDVYYILAFNEKENVNLASAKKLFVKAIKNSRNKRSGAGVKSRLSLADIYYGEGNFKNSKKYYDAVINSIKDDKWYTKYLYNLSWTNFRLGNKSLSIKQMKEVHSLSRSPKYVDKGKMAKRDLGYFYADSGDLKKAKSFYKSVGGNVAKNFYDMGLFLKDKQKYSKSLTMFNSAYVAGNNKFKVMSLIELLNIYDKYGNNKYFVINARKSKGLTLTKEQRKEILFYISKRAALLQKELSQSHNKNRPGVMKKKATQAGELYFIAQELDPSLKERSLFYAAESYYSAGKYVGSLKFYNDVREIKNVKEKYYSRAVIGMLTVINEPSLSQKNRRKYFEAVYIDYIKIERNMKKKGRAVEKLFSYFVDEKRDPVQSEKLFFQYSKVFPKNLKKNEAMIGRIVDLYKRAKKKKKLLAFVSKLKSTGIPLSKRFVKRLNKIVLTTQFESVQKENKKGNKVFALKGYISIYKDSDSTKPAKRNAAYNISVLFYELGNMRMMNDWMERSISEMTSSEVRDYADSYALMIKELYLRQRFKKGAKRTEELLKKMCSKKSKSKDELLVNYIVMKLSDNQDNHAIGFYNSQLKCSIKNKSKVTSIESFINFYIENNQFKRAHDFYKKYEKLSSNKLNKIKYLGGIMAMKRRLGIKSGQRDIKSLSKLYRLIKKKSKIAVDAIDEYAFIELARVQGKIRKFKKTKLSYPEKKFNKGLQTKFRDLDKLTKALINVLKIGSGKAMVRTYLGLIDSYGHFSAEIGAFSPPKVSADYAKSFKRSMKAIITPLNEKIRQFKKELDGQVKRNSVLSIEYGMRSRANIPFAVEHEFVIMDKRGM